MSTPITSSTLTSNPLNGTNLNGSTPSVSSASSSTSSSTSSLGGYNLKPADFIKLMVTELQNQDPTKPASNEDLLAQMSQIGQLQSSNTLQSTLQSLSLQNQIGAASNMIGKSVSGLDDSSNPVSGTVNSVRIQSSGNKAYLELDNGKELDVSKVTTVAPAAAPTTAGTSTTATTTTKTAA